MYIFSVPDRHEYRLRTKINIIVLTFIFQTLCKETYQYEPSMAFIIVKKRISTRFFLPNSKTKTYMNPPPGTVVDSTVTDPTM